ncbi:MAG: tetraacyldisaccharide 4'-kinase [Halioglobus sp.]
MAAGERGLVAAWYRGAWWLWLLRPLEFLFRGIAAVRKGLYHSGVLSRTQPDKPLVVVGNITVGGTGKTPVVLALIEYLQSQGLRPGLVSRGYGATRKVFPHTVSLNSSAADCGDEALLIFQRTGCPCVVAPSRPDAVHQLLRDFTIDVILSDDGLQHYALGRDMEIAVLDESRGVGNGFCLPAGPLREPVSRLRSVDHVLYRGSDDSEQGVRYTPECLVNLSTGEERPLNPENLSEKIYAVAGIGQPEQFFNSLSEMGFTVDDRVFDDHHAYRAEDLAPLSDKPIIMTEKDAVKCREFATGNTWYLKISAVIPVQVQQSVAALATRSRE